MKLHAILLAAFCALLATLSCTHQSAADTLAQARVLAEENNTDQARSLCLSLLEDRRDLTAEDYCDLALTFMQLAELTDDSADINSAIACYQSAVATDVNAANQWFRNATGSDNDRRIMLLFSIVGSMENPADLSTAGAEPDSVASSLE